MKKTASPASKRTGAGISQKEGQAAPRLGSFKVYYFGTLTGPRRTFEALLADDRRLKFGFFALLISTALYTLVYIFLSSRGGAPSSFTPFLAIPRDVYYQYDRFFLAPTMIMCWILAAGVAQLLSRAFSGQGSFEDMLSVFGFGIGISTLASLVHDLPDSFLGAIGLLDLRWYEQALNSATVWRTILWTFYSLSFVLFLILFPKGVGAAQRIRRGPAILVGVLSFFVYQVFFIIFNR